MPLGNFSTTSRSSAPSRAERSTLLMKSMVRWQRVFSSAKLASVSGMDGASIPASRAIAALAVSEAIWN